MVYLEQQKIISEAFYETVKEFTKQSLAHNYKKYQNGYSKLVKKVVINQLYFKTQLLPAMP